jgi:O-acetylserine/cysteine efflux transporter
VAALPVLFLPRPAVSWKLLAGMALFLFTGQFVLLFIALRAGLPPGLSSVLVQLHGPLTVVLAALFRQERATAWQWVGLGVALLGVGLIAHSVQGGTSMLAVGIACLSALSWAIGNLFLREVRSSSLFAVTAWACLLPIVPLLAVSAAIDGVGAALAPILMPTGRGWLLLLYTVVPAMWLGYWIWGTLLRTYPAAKVGPVSLLVPCCALVISALLTGEPVGGVRLLGVAVVLAGVALGMLSAGGGRKATID